MSINFNNRIKQVLLLSILILLIWVVIQHLYICLPGLLGAVTLYILSRGNNFQLVYHKKGKSRRAFCHLLPDPAGLTGFSGCDIDQSQGECLSQ